MSATLTFSEVTCRLCGDELEQVNAGHSDGAVANWVGSCVRCRRQWVVVAEMMPVPSRGSDGHPHGSAT